MTSPTQAYPDASTRRLCVGAAKVDITPNDLSELNPIGGGSFTAVHDPIYARAIVLEDGAHQVALVGTDLIEVGDMRALRDRIQRELGIPSSHVAITATHAHNAPRLGDVSPGALAHGGGPEQKAYTAWVYDQILAALRDARAALRPARVGFGTGQVDVNVNRDVLVGDRWELGANPAGPSDKTVSVLRFDDLDGRTIAVWFSYAVHSTVTLWTGLLSGDLAGAAERAVESELDGEVVALFAPGALGDQNPRVSFESSTADQRQDPDFAFDAAQTQGCALATETLRVARGITEMHDDVPVYAAELVVSCPTKRGEDVMEDMRQEQVDTVELRLTLVRIGDVALAGANGEVVTPIGRRLRAESPLPHTVPVSLVNDRVGYLVDDAAFDLNTFEVRGCPVRRGYAEHAIVDGLLRLIEESQAS